jgi:hypothetical protein
MHQREIGAFQSVIRIQSLPSVARARQLRIRLMESFKRLLAMVGGQVSHAPRVFGLEHAHLMSARGQLRNDPAKKVRISVIPVR